MSPCIEQGDHVVSKRLPDPGLQLVSAPAWRLAVAPRVDGEDAIAGHPAPDGIRPTRSGVTKPVQQDQRWAGLKAEVMDDQIAGWVALAHA